MTVLERLAEALGSSAFLGFPAHPALQPQLHAEQGLNVTTYLNFFFAWSHWCHLRGGWEKKKEWQGSDRHCKHTQQYATHHKRRILRAASHLNDWTDSDVDRPWSEWAQRFWWISVRWRWIIYPNKEIFPLLRGSRTFEPGSRRARGMHTTILNTSG